MMDGSNGFNAQIFLIPGGLDGVRSTLRQMVAAVRSFTKPKPHETDKIAGLLMVRLKAQTLVQHCAPKDYWAEADVLHRFVRDEIRYVRDIRSMETLFFPDKTLNLKAGDCDDMAILFSTLAETIGFETRFCAIGVNGEEFSHVSAQALIPGFGWINAETIPIDDNRTKVALGWFPPDATCLMLAHV